jgi:hypothetical protein
MKNNNCDETAFPAPVGQVIADRLGMSLRDWFAGQALQGIVANPNTAPDAEMIAHAAYRIANEMMEARKALG